MSSAGIFDENISAVWAIWREQNNRVFHFCGMSYLARTFTASRSFSVKSAYYLMSSAGKAKSRCPSVCSARVTPSTQIFFVLLLKDKLLTQDVMLRRKNCDHNGVCALWFWHHRDRATSFHQLSDGRSNMACTLC
jgi:hypothetical protein